MRLPALSEIAQATLGLIELSSAAVHPGHALQPSWSALPTPTASPTNPDRIPAFSTRPLPADLFTREYLQPAIHYPRVEPAQQTRVERPQQQQAQQPSPARATPGRHSRPPSSPSPSAFNHKVYEILCRCDALLTDRGMRAVLLLRSAPLPYQRNLFDRSLTHPILTTLPPLSCVQAAHHALLNRLHANLDRHAPGRQRRHARRRPDVQLPDAELRLPLLRCPRRLPHPQPRESLLLSISLSPDLLITDDGAVYVSASVRAMHGLAAPVASRQRPPLRLPLGRCPRTGAPLLDRPDRHPTELVIAEVSCLIGLFVPQRLAQPGAPLAEQHGRARRVGPLPCDDRQRTQERPVLPARPRPRVGLKSVVSRAVALAQPCAWPAGRSPARSQRPLAASRHRRRPALGCPPVGR